MDILECYKGIIGLSRTTCEGYANPPEDYDVSKSGFYLDELQHLSQVRDLEDCESGAEVWDLMTQARDQGILTFQADVNSLLMEHYRVTRMPYTGNLGRVKMQRIVNIHDGQYAIVRLRAANVKGAQISLSKIGGTFEKAGTVQIDIYDNHGEKKTSSPISLSTLPRKHVQVSIEPAITLPLWSDLNPDLEYFVVYQCTGGNRPYENDLDCGCGNRMQFNTLNPYTNAREVEKGMMWAKYVMIGGLIRDSIDDLSDLGSTAQSTMLGLTLYIKASCEIERSLCDGEFEMEGNPMGGAIALAIRFKAAELLIDKILKSPNLNRSTLIHTDTLKEAKVEIIQNYQEYTSWIVKNIDLSGCGCLEEREWIELKRGITR